MSRTLEFRLRKLEPKRTAGLQALTDAELVARLETLTTAARAECGSMGAVVEAYAADQHLRTSLDCFVRSLAADPGGVAARATTYRASGAPVLASLVEIWHERHAS